jgi:hypothetical protein
MILLSISLVYATYLFSVQDRLFGDDDRKRLRRLALDSDASTEIEDLQGKLSETLKNLAGFIKGVSSDRTPQGIDAALRGLSSRSYDAGELEQVDEPIRARTAPIVDFFHKECKLPLSRSQLYGSALVDVGILEGTEDNVIDVIDELRELLLDGSGPQIAFFGDDYQQIVQKLNARDTERP